MTKLLMVTDQPFWRKENGAHQRISSFAAFLAETDFTIKIFYMVDRSERDLEICDRLPYDFVEFDAGGGRFRNWVSPLVDRGKSLLGKSSSADESTDIEKSSSQLTLDSYRWPHAASQFKSLVRSFQPDIVLSQYVVWSNLFEDWDASDRAFCTAVDTHDALHVRNRHFKESGKRHWIDISREEETRALQNFDLIISIQAEEAELFRQMVANREVIVVGHVPEVPADYRFDREERDEVRVGFVGSANHANLDGISWFLENCWHEIVQRVGTRIRLILGGPMEQALREVGHGSIPQSQYLGPVKRISEFYESIDFAINPVRFGSGLKIKTVESFCFGVPLVSHPHSSIGLSEPALKRCFVCADAMQFAQACIRLASNREFRSRVAARARYIGEHEFSPDLVYSPFLAWSKKQA